MIGRGFKRRGALRRFLRAEEGAALVEFAMVLPVLLVMLVVAVEGARTFWAYEATAAGVRDAARYLARVSAADICETGGSVSEHEQMVTTIVRESATGGQIFPGLVTIDSVMPSLACTDLGLRVSPTPVGTISAELSIRYPFAGALAFFGVTLKTAHATITDSSRIFGA